MTYLTDRVRRVIRADDTVQVLQRRCSIADVEKLIDADTLTVINLRHLGTPTMVMLVDDVGHAKGRPVNTMATHLYWANCVPGTTHEIRGDVVIAPDSDFGRD